MASTAAALNGAMVATALCVMLLHSSMGQQLAPAPPCHDYMGQQPSPPPALSSKPTLAPAPAPAPAVDCPSYCVSHCSAKCTAEKEAGFRKCDADVVAALNGCYDSCTTHYCPGKSCVHSGCGYGNCDCENTNARKCCQWCGSAGYSPAYFQCRNYYDRAVQYCMIPCQDDCNKNCTQA